MEIAKTALIVTDMQNGFVNERSRHIVPVVSRLVDHWEKAGGPILFTRYLNHPGSPFERLLRWSRMQDAPETDLIAEFADRAPRVGRVLDKSTYTMFTGEGAALVSASGWVDLVFCGIATESCVLKSAVDAFELGYTPWLVVDASASSAGVVAHDAGLLVASRFIGSGQLVTSDVATTAATAVPAGTN